jgi:TorA maturation chaperone TorD
MTEPATLECLAQLWLREPDAAGIARAKALGVCEASCAAEPASLAVAYADLFILNVYPYGTVYTDAWGEINTPAARRTAALYEAHGFESPDLSAVGAPDHLGLCLAFLGQLLSAPGTARIAGEHFLGEVSFWAPVCCLAAERDPTAHEFYRAVARATRESLLSALPLATAANEEPGAATQPGAHAGPFGVDMQADDEVRLRDIVRFLLAPARCGMFLSRSRLGMIARGLGLRLPFGSRFEVAEWLFSSAGQSDMLRALIAALGVEADAAEACYAGSAERWPAWRPAASAWLECVNSTRRTLLKMETLADCAGAIFLT